MNSICIKCGRPTTLGTWFEGEIHVDWSWRVWHAPRSIEAVRQQKDYAILQQRYGDAADLRELEQDFEKRQVKGRWEDRRVR